MKITPGKLAGLQAVSNADGIIAAAAMDQRGSLRKSIEAARGGEASEKDLIRFKELVTDTLTRFASAKRDDMATTCQVLLEGKINARYSRATAETNDLSWRC